MSRFCSLIHQPRDSPWRLEFQIYNKKNLFTLQKKSNKKSMHFLQYNASELLFSGSVYQPSYKKVTVLCPGDFFSLLWYNTKSSIHAGSVKIFQCQRMKTIFVFFANSNCLKSENSWKVPCTEHWFSLVCKSLITFLKFVIVHSRGGDILLILVCEAATRSSLFFQRLQVLLIFGWP